MARAREMEATRRLAEAEDEVLTPFRVNRAPFRVNRALFRVNRAIFRVDRAWCRGQFIRNFSCEMPHFV